MIPKIIHRVWFGNKPLPEVTKEYIENEKSICKGYTHILWDDKRIENILEFLVPGSPTMLGDSQLNPVIKSDILRYEILRLFGGIYLDTDVEVLRTFDELLNAPFFCAMENELKIGSAIIGSIPFHPATRAMSEKIYANYLQNGIPQSSYQQLIFGGPYLLTEVLKQFPTIKPLQRELFFPYHKPEIPATIHYFVGGKTRAGWTHQLPEPNTCNNPELEARKEKHDLKPKTFYGKNASVNLMKRYR
jgi:mannosyltransferase OCH1-like enzyme